MTSDGREKVVSAVEQSVLIATVEVAEQHDKANIRL